MTGGVCGLWTAALEPRNGGQPTILTYVSLFLLVVRSINVEYSHYAGTTPGPNGLDFGHSERDAFKEKIRPVIKTYIQKCWCKSFVLLRLLDSDLELQRLRSVSLELFLRRSRKGLQVARLRSRPQLQRLQLERVSRFRLKW